MLITIFALVMLISGNILNNTGLTNIRVYISEQVSHKEEVLTKTNAHSFIDAKVRLGLE